MHSHFYLNDWRIGAGPECPDCETLHLRFSQFEIARHLRNLMADAFAIRVMRAHLWRDGLPIHRFSNKQVVEQVRHLLSIGRLHVCRAPAPRVWVDSAAREEEQPDDQPLSRAPAKEKTWVKIELVDDRGVPVAREKYRVLLPDGSIREGMLDDHGAVRFDGIDPGTCKVSFPNRTADEWHTA